MPTTTNRAYPYPSGAVGVPPDVPGDIYKLAAAIDADLGPTAGTTSAPVTWTPALLNATAGNGSLTGLYWYTAGGRILNGKFEFEYGSTSTMSTTLDLLINFPAGKTAALGTPLKTHVGNGSMRDASTGILYNVSLVLDNTARFGLWLSGTTTGQAVRNDGTPITFGAGDHLSGTFSVYV